MGNAMKKYYVSLFVIVAILAALSIWLFVSSKQQLSINKESVTHAQSDFGGEVATEDYVVSLEGESFRLQGPTYFKDVAEGVHDVVGRLEKEISRAQELTDLGELSVDNVSAYISRVTPLVTADVVGGHQITAEESAGFAKLLDALTLIEGTEKADVFRSAIRDLASRGTSAVTQDDLDRFSSAAPSVAENFVFIESLRQKMADKK
ncbi:hypothetical protein P8A24_08310 [Arcanobacterium wilhelmae]|nr:hypothetical protein [Arcanobacterium wilhelmae]WFN90174.1 hypothetical protein P8A24_08310 [Arcanobacterium wilhelmae]